MTNFLKKLGIEKENLGGFCGEWIGSGPLLDVISPVDGSKIAAVKQITEDEYDKIVARAHQAFVAWRKVPAPKRGEVVRQLGNRLREFKPSSAPWSRSKWARSPPKARAKSRK